MISLFCNKITLRGHHLLSLYDYILASESESKRVSLEEILMRKAVAMYTNEQGLYIIGLLRKAISPNRRIKLVDVHDDICEKCKHKNKSNCNEIKNSIVDKKVLAFYSLEKGVYVSQYIQQRLREIGKYKDPF